MNTDSEALAEARKAVARAISVFVKIQHSERDNDPRSGEETYVIGFGVYAEYITGSMESDDVTSSAIIVPDDQHYATSRGLFELAADCFSKRR